MMLMEFLALFFEKFMNELQNWNISRKKTSKESLVLLKEKNIGIMLGWIFCKFFGRILGRHLRGNNNTILTYNYISHLGNLWAFFVVEFSKTIERIPLQAFMECFFNFLRVAFSRGFWFRIFCENNSARSAENLSKESLRTFSLMDHV